MLILALYTTKNQTEVFSEHLINMLKFTSFKKKSLRIKRFYEYDYLQ